MTAKRKRTPMRWRKARFEGAGGRWDTPMNRMIWYREHGGELELVRGGKMLAVVRPDGKQWRLFCRDWNDSADMESAKAAAMNAVRAIEKMEELRRESEVESE